MSLQRITCEELTGQALVHECDPCEHELGRVRGVILFDPASTYIARLKEHLAEGDTQSADQDLTNAIESGEAHLISETTGTYDGGAAQTGDGYGDEENRLLGYLYTLTFKDPSYRNNGDFWENAEKKHWIVCWRTESLLRIADKPASIQATDPVEKDLTSSVAWNVTASWKSKKKPAIYELDENVLKFFEGCWATPKVASKLDAISGLGVVDTYTYLDNEGEGVFQWRWKKSGSNDVYVTEKRTPVVGDLLYNRQDLEQIESAQPPTIKKIYF